MNRHRQQGSALVMAIAFLGAIVVLTALFWSSLSSRVAALTREEQDWQARQVAEAGLEKTVAALRAQQGGYSGEAPTSFGPGVFHSTVETITASEYRITAVGTVESNGIIRGQKAVAAQVRIGAGGVVQELRWLGEKHE